MSYKSNLNGRSLEYLAVKKITDKYPNINLSKATAEMQRRDLKKISKLDENVLIQMNNSCKKLLVWVEKEGGKPYSIYRFSDSAGKAGDPTDIRIIFASKELNLSLKHNNYSIKHQRPYSTAQWFGFNKGSKEDLKIRAKINLLFDKFENKCRNEFPAAKTYQEVETLKPFLYHGICKIVVDFINSVEMQNYHKNYFFKFVFGDEDIYKIIAKNGDISVIPNIKHEEIKSVKASLFSLKNKSPDKKNYLKVTFNEKISISLRIKNDTSKLFSRVVKFDTKIF
tara:strand:+ start:88 stop:933 length:846 start_codon:yes stop_codon:yes gene_type:complete